MRFTGWMIAATMALAPAAAHAQATLDRPHEILGEGVSRVVAGDFRGAIPKLNEALREDSYLREAHYNLGVAYRETGDFDRAVAEFQLALPMFADSDVGTSQVLYGMALAKDARGDSDAWKQYIAWARPRAREQQDVQVAMQRQEMLTGVKVPGTQKASR